MKSNEIRESFLKYFETSGHKRVKSSSLIPASDPTLLFTNAGMVQFKDCFLGTVNPGYTRATTSQKCVRAGGKHNDLENVGFTPRHHTFFEMLGNFSFGDYFKKDAIAFAWELITKKFGIPQDKLRVTVYEKDSEAAELWKKIGVRADWIEPLGDKDNFWAMGETGPCGPCTEIHYDWGAKPGTGNTPGTDNTGRFLEIWNLVFMQFNRDPSGTLTPLPKPSVDTGAGLERMACVLQGVFSNYETDLFTPIIQNISHVLHRPYQPGHPDAAGMHVIADHLRSTSFMIADGVTPSNEGRGYVLRRIIRRAVRYGKKLGQEQPFIYKLYPTLQKLMSHQFPELNTQAKLVQTVLEEEETKFHETLHRGLNILEDSILTLQKKSERILPGDVVFKLYDTYGFPIDLIQVIAQENNLLVDNDGFDKQLEKQRAQSSWKGGKASTPSVATKKDTKFLGYEKLEADSKLLELLNDANQATNTLKAGESGLAVFAETPFYAESGGQVSDKGLISSKDAKAEVTDLLKVGNVFVHHVQVKEGSLKTGAEYHLKVDEKTRHQTKINHTATHLLHAALRKVLGDRVKQAGSLVDSNRLRFDFTFPRGMTPEEKSQVEALVQEEVFKSTSVEKSEMGYDDAIKKGALAFFDEKYGDKVRVIRVEGFSVELCGGTHLDNTAEIGVFKILSESSVASGVRRIEAITQEKAIHFLEEKIKNLDLALESAASEKRKLEKENEKLKFNLASKGGSSDTSLWDKKFDVAGYHAVVEIVPSAEPKLLRGLVDQVRDKLQSKTVVTLACSHEGKVGLVVGLTKDLTGKLNASQLIQPLCEALGGRGGGKPDFAQAGGDKPEALEGAMQNYKKYISETLSKL